ncbi:AbrB family transcriptional regulator [Geminicoccus roseus]|uniref:AbrB family transcriptional regulator n=1 Tax=Geminicoccus roseus TaxID=404900 RepID=UPI00041CC267|nr:AbrB family transcriptional regulator [Geminicoccus roseus]
MIPGIDHWRLRVLPALLVGGIGGAVFALLHIPLAWMLGALFATTLAALAGFRLDVPNTLRAPLVVVLGVLVGSWFTPDMAGHVGRWWPSLLALVPYIAITTVVTALWFVKAVRYDPITAFFCAAPGGFSEMVLAGERAGGDLRRIALIHAIRVLVAVSLLPGFAWIMEAEGAGSASLSMPVAGPYDLVLLVLCGVVGGTLGAVLRLPAGPLLGGMVVSGAAHMAGLVHGAPPFWSVALAQLVIGAAAGCRFTGTDPRMVLRTLGDSVLSTTLMLLLAGLAAWTLHLLTGLPFPALLLAFIPGGVAETSLIAIVLAIDPAFVATHHILRIAIIVVAVPPAWQLWARLRRPRAGGR